MSADLRTQFTTACRQLAARKGQSLNAFFNSAPVYSLTPSWVRDRYYDRVHIRQEDVDTLMLFLIKDDGGKDSAKDLTAHRLAVRAMCLACDGGDDEKTASCWDNTCPLRPVSPLPYRYNEDRLS